MAKTIAEGFQGLEKSLNTPMREKSVARIETKVRNSLTKELAIVDWFLIGSWTRTTNIALPSCEPIVDILVVLDENHFDEGVRPADVFKRMHLALVNESRNQCSYNAMASRFGVLLNG